MLRIQGARNVVNQFHGSLSRATAVSCVLHVGLLALLLAASKWNAATPKTAQAKAAALVADLPSSVEEKTWVDLAPAPGLLPVIPAEEAHPASEDHSARDRGERLGKSLAPQIAIAADNLAAAPDCGLGTGRTLDPAFRRDTSTLHSRLTDGSSRYRPEHERTGRGASSPDASRRERKIGLGDSSRTRQHSVPQPTEPASAVPVPADGQQDMRAVPDESTPAPRRAAGSDPARGDGPLDARAGARSFDTIERGPARDIRWVRAASDEKHPGWLDLSAVSAPGQGVAGRGPEDQPGAVSRASAGSAPTRPGDDALALGDEISRSAAEQVRARYELEIRRRVAGTLRFPHRLALLLEQGETIVAFTVGPDGRLDGKIHLLKSAGFAEFDAEAVAAVTKAAPFPPSGRMHAVSMRIPFENPVVRAGTSMVGP